MINSKWVRGGCVAAAITIAVTLFVEADAAANVVKFAHPFDKVVHFIVYGTMAVLLSHGVGRYWLIVPLILVPAIGAADEWHQSFIPGRDALAWDWLADGAGTVFGVFMYWIWRKNRGRGQDPGTRDEG